MRIIFMGTPDFAIPSLNILLENGYNVVGVITAVDKPAGRGNKLRESAIKKFAAEKGLNILQPPNLKAPAFIEQLQELKADLQIVVAFRMLPEVVWNMPSQGTYNLHASLLPDYRGAAPINWAIINGDKETGATTFKLQHEIDTGAILFQSKLAIREDETAGELHDELMEAGAQLVLKTVQAIEKDDYKLIQQDLTADFKEAPKIHKADCEINWNQPIEQVYNLIRGMSPYPTAYTTLKDKVFKIYKAEKVYKQHSLVSGTYHILEDGELAFAVDGGYIIPTEVQIEGKRKMQVKEFMNGFQL